MDINRFAAAIVVAYKLLEKEERGEAATPENAKEALQEAVQAPPVPEDPTEEVPFSEEYVRRDHVDSHSARFRPLAPLSLMREIYAGLPDEVTTADLYEQVNLCLYAKGCALMKHVGMRHLAYRYGFVKRNVYVNNGRKQMFIRAKKHCTSEG